MLDYQLIIRSFPALLEGAIVSLEIAALGCLIGITLGTLLGLAQSSPSRIARMLVMIYATLFRGTPMLIQIAFVFYVLPQFGLQLPPFLAAVVAIGLNSAAYLSQIIRSGIMSVGKGQIEAAKVLGFSRAQITKLIVLPQAFRVIMPALGNEFITLIKDSSLASVIGVTELTKQGSLIRGRTFDAFSIYCAVALIYLVITTTLTFIMNLIERRMNRHAQH